MKDSAYRNDMWDRGRQHSCRWTYIGRTSRDQPVTQGSAQDTIGRIQRREGKRRAISRPDRIDIQLHPGLLGRGHQIDLFADNIDNLNSTLQRLCLLVGLGIAWIGSRDKRNLAAIGRPGWSIPMTAIGISKALLLPPLCIHQPEASVEERRGAIYEALIDDMPAIRRPGKERIHRFCSCIFEKVPGRSAIAPDQPGIAALTQAGSRGIDDLCAIRRRGGIDQIGGGYTQIDAFARTGRGIDLPHRSTPCLHRYLRDPTNRKHWAVEKGVPVPTGKPAQEVALCISGKQVDTHPLCIIDPDLLSVRACPINCQIASVRRELEREYCISFRASKP